MGNGLIQIEYTTPRGGHVCETCAWSVWDEGDSSVGEYGGYVVDCKCPHADLDKIEDIFEDEYAEECPYKVPQFATEYDFIRCPDCGSRDTYTTGYKEHVDEEGMTVLEETELVCKHCGHRHWDDVFKLTIW